jgi:hypothetical protein
MLFSCESTVLIIVANVAVEIVVSPPTEPSIAAIPPNSAAMIAADPKLATLAARPIVIPPIGRTIYFKMLMSSLSDALTQMVKWTAPVCLVKV